MATNHARERAASLELGPDDFTRFQLDALAVIHRLELDGDTPYGLAINQALTEYYETDVHHGRLYPNLNDLAEHGLIEKTPIDNRSYEYALSAAGRVVLDARLDWLQGKMTTSNAVADTGGDD